MAVLMHSGSKSSVLTLPEISTHAGRLKVELPAQSLESFNTVGVYGVSGSGKSTYVKALANQLEQNSLLIPQEDSSLELLRGQQMIELTLAASGRNYNSEDAAKTSKISADFGLTSRLGKFTQTYSGGERRRLALLRGIIADPDILLLDEPFVGLGVKYIRRAKGLILERARSQRKTVVVSHDHQLLWSIADVVLVLGSGRLLARMQTTPAEGGASGVVSQQALESLSFLQFAPRHFVQISRWNVPDAVGVAFPEDVAYLADASEVRTETSTQAHDAFLCPDELRICRQYQVGPANYAECVLCNEGESIEITVKAGRMSVKKRAVKLSDFFFVIAAG